MFNAPTTPPLRGKLSSQEIRELFGQVASEFALMPDVVGGGTKGFNGGTWNSPTINTPTINRGIIGTNAQPSSVVSTYSVFAKTSLTTLGAGNVGFVRSDNGRVKLMDGATVKLFTDDSHSLVVGNGSTEMGLAAVGGFLYIPSVSGIATGIPPVYPGSVAMVVNRVAKKIGLMIDGAWVWTAALT